MTTKLRDIKKNLKLRKEHFTYVTSALFVVLFAYIGYHYLFKSHASTPPNPAISVCGARNSSDVEQYSGNTALPSYSITDTQGHVNQFVDQHVFSDPNPGFVRYWPDSGGQDPRWYVMTGGGGNSEPTFTVYDANNNAQIAQFQPNLPYTFERNASSFAIDPTSGDVYVGNYNTSIGDGEVSRVTLSGADVWNAATTNLLTGGVYGYTNSSGTFLVGAVVSAASESGGNVFGENLSNTFNSSGTPEANNSVVGDVITVSTEHNNDIVAVQNQSYVRVYTNNSSGINQALEIGTSLSPGGNGPFHFYQVTGANEEGNGTLVVNDAGNGMEFFDPTGILLGRIADDPGNAINGIPIMEHGLAGQNVEEFNGNIYLMTNDNGGALMKLTESDVQTLLSAPQGAPFHLGVGAGPYTTAAYNYFTSASQAQNGVFLRFYPTWQAISAANGGINGSYTIRTIEQIKAGLPGTTYSFPVPTDTAAYSSGYANVPVTLPSTLPDYYEMSVSIQKDGNTVGADCLDYDIGTPSASFNPSSPNLNNSGGDVAGVEFAYQLGQKDFRSGYNIDSCFPDGNVNDTSANCPTQEIQDITAASALAAKYGMNYEIQFGTGSGFDDSAVSSGQWQRLVGLMAAQFKGVVTDWECWNEPNTDYTGDMSVYVNQLLIPCYNGVKAVSTSNKMIGFSWSGYDVGTLQQFVQDGGLNYVDIVALHTYTGHNRSWEEQNLVVPPLYATQADPSGTIQQDQQYLASQGYTGQLWDTESGFWDTGPNSSYLQGDKLVRKEILERSVGVNNLSNFQNNSPFQGWTLVNNGSLTTGGAASIVYKTELDGRNFINWLPTGIPHTYAAEFGPSTSDPGDMVALWAEDFSTSVVAKIGSGSINVVDEFGQSSTISSGDTLGITGSVQYLSIPQGQNLTISPPESFGTNLASASAGATATSSSNYDCSSSTGSGTNPNDTYLTPDRAIDGTDNANNTGNICDGSGMSLWAPDPTDTNPSLTISLKQSSPIDRIYIASQGLGSVETSLRNYTISFDTSSNGSGNFIDPINVTNSFFARDNMVQLPSTLNVSRIRFTNITDYASGYGDGTPPIFWGSGFPTYAPFYTVEAYAPGSTGSGGTPPTVSISNVTNNSEIYGKAFSINASSSPNNGGSISNIELLVNGSLVQTLFNSPYNFTLNTLNYTDGNYTLGVQSIDNQGDVGSTSVNAYISNGDLNFDGHVNISDLAILAANWNKSVSGYNKGDINGDGTVNIQDLAILAANWGWSE